MSNSEKSTYYLAVDLGATSGRTVLGSFDGNRLLMRELTRFKNPIIPMNNHLFWNLPSLYYEILLSLRKVAEEGITLTAIGIDTWGCDFALFDKDGMLSGLPYCYRDSHTENAMDELFKRIPAKEVYQLTGIQFMPFNSIFQLDTLKRQHCQALQNARQILFIPDALTYMLTGHAVTEYTIASTSQLINPSTGLLETKLLEAIGLTSDQFGRIVYPGETVGTLNKQARQFSGLPEIPVIAVAGHDTASAVAAVPAKDKNFAYLSCGTWSLLGIETPHPIITEDSFLHNFTNEGGLDGTTRFLKNICGLWLLERCREEFKDAPQDIAELTALCETTTFDSLINPDAPCFAHPESMTGSIRLYCRQTGQDEPQTPAEFCRCIFRSLALRYRQVLNLLIEMAPFSIERLHVIGGGSQNRYLMQYTANATGLPVICGPVEGTAIGNLLVQIKACGQVRSLNDMRQISANSVTLKTYSPQDMKTWEKAYNQFIEIQEKEKHINLI